MNRKFLRRHKQERSSTVCSTLSTNLRDQYKRRSVRVIKGDSVKVLRGEYSGVEGKVEKVNTERGTLSIEGIQREKVRGGNVKVQIHSSNVAVVNLNLSDKLRQNRMQKTSRVEEREVNTGKKSKKRRSKGLKKKRNEPNLEDDH